MKVLKGCGLAILGLIMFVALTVFGIAFTVRSTALNPAFLTKEINSVPISAIFQQIVNNTQGSQGSSPEVVTALNQTITSMEPELKKQTSAAMTQIYDYLLGKKSEPQIAITLRNTFLSNEFMDTLIEKVPLATIATSMVTNNLNNMNIPGQERPLLDDIGPAFTSAEPSIKTQLENIAPQVIDYLLGNTTTLNATLNLQPVIDSLKAAARTLVQQSLPAEIASLPPDQLNSYIDQYINQDYGDILNSIPATTTINETWFGPDVASNIQNGLSQTDSFMVTARKYIAIFQQCYLWLIILMVVLAAGIAGIHHSVRGASRSLGWIFLWYGILTAAPILLFRLYIAPKYIFPHITSALPVYMVNYIEQVPFNVITPLQNLSLGFLAAGVVLLVVSFVYPKRKPSEVLNLSGARLVRTPAASQPQSTFSPPSPISPPQPTIAPQRVNMYCRNCGKEVENNAKFCHNCGQPVNSGTLCPACGATTNPQAMYCVKCGASLETKPVVTKKTGKSKTTAVLLTVFLGFWAWLYTYKKAPWKFWLNLGLTIITFGIWYIVAWIWAIIDTVRRPSKWYESY